jgi:diacylglycerol kinase family enzyme
VVEAIDVNRRVPVGPGNPGDRVTVPAFINPASGNAKEAREALEAAGGIDVRETDPADLAKAIAAAVAEGARRIIVAGGDGSIATAASVIAGTDVVLGILPAGTLNHRAKDLHIPLDLGEAARLALAGDVVTIDVGRAGERIFVNTSSVGAYVLYVRTRERLEPRLGYWLASHAAGVRIMFRLSEFSVGLEVEGARRSYRTPLIFVGVDEREVKLPKLGGRVEGGKRGLHIIIVETGTRARLLALAFAAAARGLKSVARTPALDAFLVESSTIEHPFATARIAVDGEIIEVRGPVEYTIWRDALRVVVPLRASLEKDSRAR